MTNWSQGRMLAFDLESTGTDPLTARIVQVALVDIVPADAHGAPAPAVAVDRWSALVNPGDDIEVPAEAAEVHGLTTERVRAEGRPAAEIVPHVVDRLHAAWRDGAVVVGHNLGGYDISLIAAEAARHGRTLTVTGCIADTLCLDRSEKVDRYRRGSRKLADVARVYDVRLDAEHDATEDALASARIAWRMCRRYPELAAMSRDDLMAYQAEQHAAWAENFEAYLKRRKREDKEPQADIDAVHISREWPIRYPDPGKAAA